MKRRTFITIGGSALTTILAGCLGGGDDASTDDASTDDASTDDASTDDLDNDLVKADAGALLLSSEELSETLPGDWQKGESFGEEVVSDPVGVDTQEFTQLVTEDQTEGLLVIVRVFESIEDAKMFVDDELDTATGYDVQEEDVGDEAYAASDPESEITSFFARQTNATVSVVGTIHVSWLREITEIQVDELR